MRQVLGAGALGRPRGIGWRGRWEGELGWGIQINLWLIHVNVWQKPLEYCKVISLQLIKINEKKFNIQKTKIMASSPITIWKINREKMERVTDFIYLVFISIFSRGWGKGPQIYRKILTFSNVWLFFHKRQRKHGIISQVLLLEQSWLVPWPLEKPYFIFFIHLFLLVGG